MRQSNETGLSSFETNKTGELAQKSFILEIADFLWHKTAVPIFIERFLLAVLATILFSVCILNLLGMDNIQRFTLGVAVVFLAGFLAQTLYKHNQSKDNSNTSTQTVATQQSPTNTELKQEVAKFVISLQDFNQRMAQLKQIMELNSPNLQEQKQKELQAAKTEKKRHEIYARYSLLEGQAYTAWQMQFKSEYDKNYYAKAKMLREEMVRRIPPDRFGQPRTLIYENLAGPSPIREITYDLEKLSSLLPD